MLGFCYCMRAFSSCGVWASRCGGFSCGMWALGHTDCSSWGLRARQLWHLGPTAWGIPLNQGSNTCPLHWQADSQPLDHRESPQHTFVEGPPELSVVPGEHKSPGCLLVSILECDRSQGSEQLKKFQRRHKTSRALLMWFLPDEATPLPPRVTPGTQGRQASLSGHHMGCETILSHKRCSQCVLPGPQLIPRTPHPHSFRPLGTKDLLLLWKQNYITFE